MDRRIVLRRLLTAVASWIVGVAVFWLAVRFVYGPLLDAEGLLRVLRVSGLALAVTYPLVYMPLFGIVVRNWRGEPRLPLAVLGGLLMVVPFAVVLVFAIGFDLSHLVSYSAGETVPSLLLFGVSGGLFGLFYR